MEQPSGAPAFQQPCGNINPLGITGTPAVDGTNVYVVAEIQDTPTSFHYDLDTGPEHRHRHSPRQHHPCRNGRQQPAAALGALLVNNGCIMSPSAAER